jgi:hypothetical protein
MRNLLALAATALLIFAGVGWYLGWYQITSSTDSSGHREIQIDLNSPKISEDLNRGKEKVRDLLDSKKPVAPSGSSGVVPTVFHPESGSPYPESNIVPPSENGPRLPRPE